MDDKRTCDECANYECDNFDGVGWCNLYKAMVLHDDSACKEFHELPDDGERHVVDMMKSTGHLFPETDEQMAAFEAGARLHELPERFRPPDFVFEEASKLETDDKKV